MNCMRCFATSITAQVYVLADGKRSVCLCCGCYNKLQDELDATDRNYRFVKEEMKLWHELYVGAGPAELGKACGMMTSTEAKLSSYRAQLVARIDDFIRNKKENNAPDNT